MTLGLGSNLGDRERFLASARELLVAREVLVIERASEPLDTAPVGPPQPRYLNQVVLGHTTLDPGALLEAVTGIEDHLGRVRGGERWGPRCIDIDILDYDRRTVHLPGLVVPHPRIAEREFVLDPWASIDPQHVVPGLERSVRELLDALREGSTP